MLLRTYLHLLALSLVTRVTLGAIFFQNTDEFPSNTEYDFIVAGGGTGGGAVAARLAENPEWKVLIIEAGPSNLDVFNTRPPGLCGELISTPVDWNYTTIEQPGLNGRTAPYSRGKMLGGCSSHNGMVYTRGSRDDWDNWARITGDESLSWDNMLPFIFKAEKLIQDSENQPEQNHIDPSVHGHDGPLFVTAGYTIHPFNDMLLQVTKELRDEFPFVLDMNAGRPIGISWNQYTIDHNAERSSSATAYVEMSGENLHVLLNTYVTRVLEVGDGSDFRGVEFAADAQSARKQLIAKKEVIIAGGVIGTPQILLNSGIGNRSELEAVGVKVLVDNPSVGKNFSDQVYTVGLVNTTIEDTDYDVETALAEWNSTRTGPMGLPAHVNHMIFVRFPVDAPLFNQDGFTDPSPGKNAPHIEIHNTQISTQLPNLSVDVPLPPESPNLRTIQFSLVNLHPVSRGSISLNSSDPFAYPNIDPGLLTEEVDLAILREGFQSAQRLYTAPVFSESVSERVFPPRNESTDTELNAFLRASAGPYSHGGCSATMSPWGASWGVVDPDFRVKGAKGLRVVDASVLPTLPSGHPQAVVYSFAERASVLIAEAWEGKPVNI